MNIPHRRTLTLPSRFIRAEDRPGTPKGTIGYVVGHAAVFESDSHDLGGYIERIRAGAFDESLRANDVVALFNHCHDKVMGRMSAGTLKLAEDAEGLAYDIAIPDTSFGRDLVVLAERADLKSCSFGFDIKNPADMEWSERDGVEVCTLLKIDLHEISVGVTFPAYEATTMSLRERYRGGREGARSRARDRARLALRG